MSLAATAASLGSHAAEIYAKLAADHDHADKDFSAIIEMIRNAQNAARRLYHFPGAEGGKPTMQPTAQTQDDWKKAIEFCQVVDNAYHIPPAPTFMVGGTNYKIVANIYANDLATDANQGITDQVIIGLICQTDPGGDVVIAIRGTEGILEWAHDLNFDKVPCPFLPGAGQTDD